NLKALGALLVNIHGQHEHQTLQSSAAQRQMLDARGGLSAPLTRVADAFDRWQALETEQTALQAARDQRDERMAFLTFQLDELNGLDPADGELAALAPEQARLANAERLVTGSDRAVSALADDDNTNALSLVAAAAREVGALSEFDPELKPVLALIDEAEVSISEAADSLRSYLTRIDMDPARLEVVEQRLADYQRLSRKHQVDGDALAGKRDALQQELEALRDADETLDALAAECDAARSALTKEASKLTKARQKAAKTFASEVTAGMQTLGMPGGQFDVALEPHSKVSRHGADQIRFLVSANPGQPLQPIQKVASGGELSRISLAIQVAAGRRDAVKCMIFDEVDSGVGGGVAEMVGRQMRALAESCQVLAVTHLPQVAGQAHAHHKVTKLTDGKTTRTGIQTLSRESRVEEIARMLGGVEITDVSLTHAREMIEAAG
ncbi:MAG: DNA repair protein RecN, partial [Pseudomonadota bacterium]